MRGSRFAVIVAVCSVALTVACSSGSSPAGTKSASAPALLSSSSSPTSATTAAAALSVADLLTAVGRHCTAGRAGRSIAVQTAVEVSHHAATERQFLESMRRLIGKAKNVECTDLLLDMQVGLSDNGKFPRRVTLSTHPANPGAQNLEDCPSLKWPVAIPNDIQGQLLGNAFVELVCFNVSARAPDGHDPLDVAGDDGMGWRVIRTSPGEGTRVGKNTHVVLIVRPA